jgi:hypothetical protein
LGADGTLAHAASTDRITATMMRLNKLLNTIGSRQFGGGANLRSLPAGRPENCRAPAE